MKLSIIVAALSLPLLAQQTAADALKDATIIRRVAVNQEQDLVVALASPRPQALYPDGRFNWSLQNRLALFLQDRSGGIQQLASEPGPNDDCAARIERVTSQELVLSCIGEKWSTYANRKFVFDARAAKLLNSFAYQPHSFAQVLSGPRFVMANRKQLLLVDIDPANGAPRVVPDAQAQPALARIPMEVSTAGDQTFRTPAPQPDPVQAFGPRAEFRLSRQKNQFGSEYTVITGRAGKLYPLAQSDLLTWQRARPDDAKMPIRPNPAEKNEEIGPHQLEGVRLWFGKTFYNSEGSTGVGGFGYFDAAATTYHLYSPPEILRWSVSAILVEADSVWLALYRRGEYGNSPGGLLRWDRRSARVQSFPMAEIATAIARQGDAIYLAGQDGIDVWRNGQISRYFVDRSAAGRYTVALRN